MICGSVLCGSRHEDHIRGHYSSTLHAYAIEIGEVLFCAAPPPSVSASDRFVSFFVALLVLEQHLCVASFRLVCLCVHIEKFPGISLMRTALRRQAVSRLKTTPPRARGIRDPTSVGLRGRRICPPPDPQQGGREARGDFGPRADFGGATTDSRSSVGCPSTMFTMW